MKKHPVRVVFIVLFSFLGAWLFVMGSLNYAGFCIPERRFLSDHEKIKIAIESVESEEFLSIEDKERKNVYFKHARYRDANDFLQQNPDCCSTHYDRKKIGGEGIAPRQFWSRVFGTDAGSVFLKYRADYIDEEGLQKSIIRSLRVDLQNCGQVN